MMKIYIVHTESGEIRSVVRMGEVSELPPGMTVPVMLAEGEQATEISSEEISAESNLLEIHENYRFDVERGTLVRKDEG
jgi:hypothetical protein